MTMTARIRIAFIAIAGLLSAGLAAGYLGYISSARADTPELVAQAAPAPAVDAISGPGAAVPADSAPLATEPTEEVTPAEKLRNPVDDPVGAYSDLKMAKRIGWGAVFLVVVIMACGLLGRLGGVFAPLGRPRVMFAWATVSTAAATLYNALALGGSLLAAAATAIPLLVAGLLKVWQWQPATSPTE